MIEENKIVNRFNLFDYPIIKNLDFHYRGQLPKVNKTKDNCSQ